jgi:predicted porin
MKKTLIALASVAALGAAHADVTLYGVADLSVLSNSNMGSADGNNPGMGNTYANPGQQQMGLTSSSGTAGSAPGRTTSMFDGLLQPSRWGIKGSEDLGSGMKANFVLESALDVAGGTNPNDHALLASTSSTKPTDAGDSSLNGQMFSRQSTVGLSGDFGSVDLGYQLNLTGEITGDLDPFNGGRISPLGWYGGLGAGAGSSFTGRQSNSIKYKYAMGNTTIGAFYAMGGYSGNAGQGAQSGLSLVVQATPTLKVDASVSRMNDNVGFTAGYVAPAYTATNGLGYATTAPNSGISCAVSSPTNSSTSTPSGAACTFGATPALTATYFNSVQTVLGAAWQATPTMLVKFGYSTYTDSNPSNGSGDALVQQTLGVPIVNPNTNPFGSNKTVSSGWLGVKYDVTPMDHFTAAYYTYTISAYTATSNQATVSGTSSTAVSKPLGQSSAPIIALAWDHDLSKKTDVYAAAAVQHFDNGNQWQALNNDGTPLVDKNNALSASANGLAGQSISFIAAGVRMKF